MKKSICFIFAVCLCFTACSALAAQSGLTLFGPDESGYNTNSVESMAALGDTLVMGTMGDPAFYVWTPGQEDAVPIESDFRNENFWVSEEELDTMDEDYRKRVESSIQRLISDGTQLYGLNSVFGSVRPLTLADGKLTAGDGVALDWESLSYQDGSYSSMREIYGAVIQEGYLFLLVQKSNSDWNNCDLYRYDLKDGSRTLLASTYIRGICEYKDGKLLAKLYDQEKSTPNGQEIMPDLMALDIATGQMEKINTFPNVQGAGLSYDAATDSVYYLGRGEIWSSAAGAPFQVTAYLPCDYPNERMPAAFVQGGYYAAVPDYNGVFIRNIDPSMKPDRVLRISGSYANDVHNAFVSAHPEIPVIFAESYLSGVEAITQNMMSGSSSVDIFRLSPSYEGFTSLRDKGYCLELSKSQILSDAAAAMYPQFTKELYKDGKLYAVPSEIYGSTLAYAPSVLEEIGLTQEDLPKNFLEMVDFAVDWVETYADEFPNLKLFQYVYDIRSQLFSQAVSEYMSYYEMTGQELAFDTPLFHKLLAKIEEAAPVLSELDPEPGSETGYGWSSDDTPTSLFWWDYGFTPGNFEMNGYELCLLPLDDGLDPVLNASLQVYIVNPNSPNADLALTYLEFLTQNMRPEYKVALYPGENEPVEESYYQENLKYYNERLEDFQKQLEKAEADGNEEAVKSIKEQLEWLAEDRESMERWRWTVSPEQIENYRAIDKYINVNVNDLIYGSNGEVAKLVSRYTQGEMTGDQFIKEFDRKIRMIQMENR